MEKRACLSRVDEEKLVGVYRTLQEFAEHEFPVVRLNCRKAQSELCRALFELGLMGEAEVRLFRREMLRKSVHLLVAAEGHLRGDVRYFRGRIEETRFHGSLISICEPSFPQTDLPGAREMRGRGILLATRMEQDP